MSCWAPLSPKATLPSGAPLCPKAHLPFRTSLPSGAAFPSGASLPSVSSSAWESVDYHLHPKVITIVDGTGVPRPRPNVKFLLNRQSVQSYEQFARDVAYALGKASSVQDSTRPSVRLFTVRGREVAAMSDLFRDDDVFIGVGVGRKELNVSEVRQIFQELYPNNGYSETLVRKWMRTRRRQVRPRQTDRVSDLNDATTSEVISRPEETTAPEADIENANEAANPAEVENETYDLKPAEDKFDDVQTSEDGAVVETSRLKSPESRQSQSLVRPSRAPPSRRGGSEPRRGKVTLPPLASTSSVHHDAADPAARSRPRQRGQRQLRLPPLQTDADQGSKSSRNVRSDDHDAVSPNAADREAPRHDGENRSPPKTPRRSVDRSRPAGPSPSRDVAAVKTDENYNVITEVPSPRSVKGKSRSDPKDTRSGGGGGADSGGAKVSSRSEKEKKRSRRGSDDVKMKTKFERQVSTVDHVTGTCRHVTRFPADHVTGTMRHVTSVVDHVTSCYAEGRVLGDGNFAVVKKCRHRETGREFAMKIIDKSKMANKVDMIENEIAIMKQCDHVNIVRLYEEYETKNEIYLIMELVKVSSPPHISLICFTYYIVLQ